MPLSHGVSRSHPAHLPGKAMGHFWGAVLLSPSLCAQKSPVHLGKDPVPLCPWAVVSPSLTRVGARAGFQHLPVNSAPQNWSSGRIPVHPAHDAGPGWEMGCGCLQGRDLAASLWTNPSPSVLCVLGGKCRLRLAGDAWLQGLQQERGQAGSTLCQAG